MTSFCADVQNFASLSHTGSTRPGSSVGANQHSTPQPQPNGRTHLYSCNRLEPSIYSPVVFRNPSPPRRKSRLSAAQARQDAEMNGSRLEKEDRMRGALGEKRRAHPRKGISCRFQAVRGYLAGQFPRRSAGSCHLDRQGDNRGPGGQCLHPGWGRWRR